MPTPLRFNLPSLSSKECGRRENCAGQWGGACVCSSPTSRPGRQFSGIPTLSSWSGSGVSQLPPVNQRCQALWHCIQVLTPAAQMLASAARHNTHLGKIAGWSAADFLGHGRVNPISNTLSSSTRPSRWRSVRWIRATTLALGRPDGQLREQMERSLLCRPQSCKPGTQLTDLFAAPMNALCPQGSN